MSRGRGIIYIALMLLGLWSNAQAQETQEEQKVWRAEMSPMVRAKLHKSSAPMYVFIKSVGDVADLYAANGCEVLAEYGDIQIVRLQREKIDALASDERVRRIEMGRINSLTNAVSTGYINATKVHEGVALPQAYTGKGVVVGIEDIGFDLTNPNFYSRDMSSYRIQALWDMLSTDTVGSSMPIGNEYIGKDALLAYEHSRDGLTNHHGSHTLGSAAGSGYMSEYAGIAYESDICLVSNVVSENMEYLSDDVEEDYGSALTVLGFKYIFDYADSVDKPCVISLSEGSYQGFDEDNLLYFEVLDSLVRPGRIIVASAGNSSTNACYFRKPQGQERGGSFVRKSSNQIYFMTQGSNDYIARVTVYGAEKKTFDLDTSLLRALPDSIMSDTLLIDDEEYAFEYVAYPSCYDADNIVVECLLTGPNHIGYDDVAPISIEVLGESADVEVYSLIGNLVSNDLDASLCDGETSHNVNLPSAAPAVISVGATAYTTSFVNIFGDTMTYNNGEGGERARFSSIGPTLDGRIKPDVMAPGVNIVSSTNSFYFEANPDSNQWTDLIDSYEYNGRTYYWKSDAGTSMSSPLVAGAIALWLEAKPDLTREELIELFASTCSQPDKSLSYPNNYYGYGQIDVYRGLLQLLGIDGIRGLSTSQPMGVHFSVEEHHIINISFDEPLARRAVVRVYSTSGQALKTISIAAGTQECCLALDGMVGSVVAVQVYSGCPSTTGSTLLRL